MVARCALPPRALSHAASPQKSTCEKASGILEKFGMFLPISAITTNTHTPFNLLYNRIMEMYHELHQNTGASHENHHHRNKE
jgi:hypothetical protein